MTPHKPGRTRLFAASTVLRGALALLIVTGCVRWATASPPPPPPLPDGAYENVLVEGRLVPMIHVKDGASVVLVDVDGKLPRTWEEQFRRKGGLPPGTFNIHKTEPAGTMNFERTEVDREGLWVIDSSGNITAQ